MQHFQDNQRKGDLECLRRRMTQFCFFVCQALPVVLLKILQTGVELEGSGNLYSIHLHSCL